jgi:hypothetical protein
MEDEHQEAIIPPEIADFMDKIVELFIHSAARAANPHATVDAMLQASAEKMGRLVKYEERLNNPDLEAAPENIAAELRPWADDLRHRAANLIATAKDRKRQLDIAPNPQEIVELNQLASLEITRPDLADKALDQILERAEKAARDAARIGSDLYADLRRFDHHIADIDIVSARNHIAGVERVLRHFRLVRFLSWLILSIAFVAVIGAWLADVWSLSPTASLAVALAIYFLDRVLGEFLPKWGRSYLRSQLPNAMRTLWFVDANITAEEKVVETRLSEEP